MMNECSYPKEHEGRHRKLIFGIKLGFLVVRGKIQNSNFFEVLGTLRQYSGTKIFQGPPPASFFRGVVVVTHYLWLKDIETRFG